MTEASDKTYHEWVLPGKDDLEKRILCAIYENPGLSVYDMYARWGHNHESISSNLQTLIDTGLIVETGKHIKKANDKKRTATRWSLSGMGITVMTMSPDKRDKFWEILKKRHKKVNDVFKHKRQALRVQYRNKLQGDIQNVLDYIYG